MRKPRKKKGLSGTSATNPSVWAKQTYANVKEFNKDYPDAVEPYVANLRLRAFCEANQIPVRGE